MPQTKYATHKEKKIPLNSCLLFRIEILGTTCSFTLHGVVLITELQAGVFNALPLFPKRVEQDSYFVKMSINRQLSEGREI